MTRQFSFSGSQIKSHHAFLGKLQVSTGRVISVWRVSAVRHSADLCRANRSERTWHTGCFIWSNFKDCSFKYLPIQHYYQRFSSEAASSFRLMSRKPIRLKGPWEWNQPGKLLQKPEGMQGPNAMRKRCAFMLSLKAMQCAVNSVLLFFSSFSSRDQQTHLKAQGMCLNRGDVKRFKPQT